MPKPAALLVGPVDQFQRRLRDNPQVVQRVHHLQPGEHAQRPVELPPRRLAVEVAAEQNRQPVLIAASPAGEHVADLVDPHGQPRRLALGAEPVAATLVHVGQRQPPHAALRRGADRRHPHKAVPQPLAIDALVGLDRHAKRPSAEAAHLARRTASCKRVARNQWSVVSMRAVLFLLVGLAFTGCKLVDQTTFAPSPEAKTTVPEPPKVDPRAPLLTIGYATPSPNYQDVLRYAVREAESRAPGVQYDVIAMLPAGGDAAAGQHSAVEVMRAIMAQGVPASRIHLGLRSEPAGVTREVRVYVQ